MLELEVNGERFSLAEIDPDTPLLWVLRDTLGLVGTKFGCGIGQCGACMVLAEGKPVRACLMPISAVGKQALTTIEGLANEDGSLSELQQAWIDLDVAQCGYCQAGQIMSATALLSARPDPSDDQIDEAMAGNLCRCGTYLRIRSAIRLAAERRREGKRSGGNP